VRAEEVAALQAQEEDHWWFRARRRILAALLEPLLREEPPRRVVDLGCGAGVDLERLPLGCAVRVGVEPVVCPRPRDGTQARRVPADLAPANVAPAGSARAVTKRVLFVRARAEAAPLSAGKFDLALALDVLEHLDDDAVALAEAARLLRAGGLLLVTVPAGPALWSEHDEALGHRRRYRRRDLARLVAGAGFEIERLTHFNTLLFAPAAAYRWARRSRRQALEPERGAGRGVSGASGSDGVTPEGRAGAPVSDTRRLGNAGAVVLEPIFAAERWWLRRADFRFGLSLLCLARCGEADARGGGGSGAAG
jgi:SAM-dependent methyltransferase